VANPLLHRRFKFVFAGVAFTFVAAFKSHFAVARARNRIALARRTAFRKSRPMPRNMSRISPNDFLPKFLWRAFSRSERCTRSRMRLDAGVLQGNCKNGPTTRARQPNDRVDRCAAKARAQPVDSCSLRVFFKVNKDRHVILD
jgi:hypothetical protein